MNLLILGGNSQRNQPWAEEVAGSMKDSFEATRVQNYRHWLQPGTNVDFEYEFDVMVQTAATMQHFKVFAKSIGSLLTLKGLAEKQISPVSCLLVGLPLRIIPKLDDDVAGWLQKVDIPVTIAQNQADPQGSYAAVKQYVDRIGNPHIQVTALDGDTHDYLDLAKLKSLVTQLPA